MNKTKKRAHKRAKANSLRFPFPLTYEHKIANLKWVRTRLNCRLAVAKQVVEEAMIDAGVSPYTPLIDNDLLI